MAGILTQDEIKWILSIDAKGVNKEIAVTSSEIHKLSQANKMMAADMKAAEQQIKQQEKEMSRLTRAGQQNSAAYQQAKATRDSARADMEDYTRKIADNNRAIENNRKKISELTAGMNLNEMSMKQLRQRAAELQKQLNVTSAAANPQAYRALQKDLSATKTRMAELRTTGTGLMDNFSAIPGPAGRVASSIRGIIQAMKAMMATPIGLALAAITAGFFALKSAINSSDTATTQFRGNLQGLKANWEAMSYSFSQFMLGMKSLFSGDFKGFKEHLRYSDQIAQNSGKYTRNAREAKIEEDALVDRVNKRNSLMKANNEEAERLRLISKDMSLSDAERQEASERIYEIEKNTHDLRNQNIIEQNENWLKQNMLFEDNLKTTGEIYNNLDKYNQMLKDGTELTYEQRSEMVKLANDVAAQADWGSQEDKEKFIKYYDDMADSNKQYHKKIRRDISTSAEITNSQRAAQIAAEKAALQQRLQDVDSYVTGEKNILLQQLMEKKINQDQYNREIERLEMEALTRKLDIYRLDANMQQEILLSINEKKLEMQQQIEQEEKEHQDRLKEIQQKAEKEKSDRNLATLKRIAEQNEDKFKEEFEREMERKSQLVDLGMSFANEMGTLLGGAITGNEDMVKSSLKAIINMALDALKAQVQIAVVGVTAQGLAQSMLNPTALAKAAVKIALIEAAFAAVKGVVNSALSSKTKTNTSDDSAGSAGRGSYVVTGRQDGGYVDVTREQDKKKYIAKFQPNKRGYINQPTVIVGDGPAGKSAEWVASNDALQNPTIAPFIKLLDESQKAGNIRTIDLNHIMRARMAGFESGGFIDRNQTGTHPQSASTSVHPSVSTMSGQEMQLIKDVRDLLLSLKNNGVKAPIVISEFERKEALLNKSRRIGTRS